MSDLNGKAIVFLLAAILCVMLFGASAVLSGFGWMLGIGIVLGVVFLIIAGIAKFIGSIRDEVVVAKSKGEPWLALFVAWPAMIGIFIVGGLAALRWWEGGIRFKDALGEVPYYWVPVTLLFASMGVALIESAQSWLPQVPGKVAALVRGWLMLVGAPVLAPLGRLRSIREARARGERIGSFATSASVLGSFLVGAAACFVTLVMTLGVGVAVVMESFR